MSCLVDVVEGVEELLLGRLLAGDELDIVDEEKVDVAVFHAELLAGAVLYGFKELVCELVALYVSYLGRGRPLAYRLADGKQQVGLAEAGVAVDKQGVVRAAGLLRYGDGGVVREAVGVADDEAVKGVSGHLGQGIVVLFLLLIVAELLLCENDYAEVGGKNIAEGVFDGLGKALDDYIALEIGARLEDEGAAVDLDGDAVVKPGGDRGRRELLTQHVKHRFPYIVKRIHAHLNTSFFAECPIFH